MLQKVSGKIGSTVGIGFTVIEKLLVGPEHVSEPEIICGMTAIFAVIGALLLLFTWKAGILPEPLDDIPILGKLEVQLKLTALELPTNCTAAELAPSQTV